MDPYEVLGEHSDISLVFSPLPPGEKGRYYPDLHVIMINDGLSQAERRCTLMHELVHRMRGDQHQPDGVQRGRQEKHCHETVARLLISLDGLKAALMWGRDPQEIADELWVDQETLRARVLGLTAEESSLVFDREQDAAWSVA